MAGEKRYSVRVTDGFRANRPGIVRLYLKVTDVVEDAFYSLFISQDNPEKTEDRRVAAGSGKDISTNL